MYDPTETELVLRLAGAGRCSLNEKPGKNWVESNGSLPNYICRIAKEIRKSGKSTSTAIAMAISQVKRWAAGGENVKADTRAKAAKALAQWEALKAKAKAKKVVKATYTHEDLTKQDYLFFSEAGEFNTDLVRRAWDDLQESLRKQAHRANVLKDQESSGTSPHVAPDDYRYWWVHEVWNTHLIVEQSNKFLKVPYTVFGDTVTFGSPTPVERVWEEIQPEVGDDLTDEEIELVRSLVTPAGSALGTIMSLSAGLR